MTLCPKCNAPVKLRLGTGPTPLISIWESELASMIAAIVAEWRRMQRDGPRPLGASIQHWTQLEGLSRWFEDFKTRT
jgi:hypothetical protein